MPSSTSIPIIVQGNSFSLAIPLQIYVISEGSMVLQDYTPDPTDEISIQLKGDRRQYTYTPTVDGNICNIDLSGNELADNYSVVVSIVKANGQRLRSFRTDQFFIVESSDDLTTDDIIQGLEENVIYLNSSIFVAGEDGRGITSIVKTSTAGLVDTYTITYTDNTTSTFQVTNGQDTDEMGVVNDYTSDDLISNYYIKLDKNIGDIVDLILYTSQTFGGMVVDVKKGDIVTISTQGGATSARAYCVTDTSRKVEVVAAPNTDTTSNPIDIHIDKDGYVYINCAISAYSNFFVKHQRSMAQMALEGVDRLNEFAINLDTFGVSSLNSGFFRLSDGIGSTIPSTPTANTDWAYICVPIKKGDTVKIRTMGGNNARAYGLTNELRELYLVAEPLADYLTTPAEITAEVDGFLYVHTNIHYAHYFRVEKCLNVPQVIGTSSSPISVGGIAQYKNNPLPFYKDKLKVLAIANSFMVDSLQYMQDFINASGIENDKICFYGCYRSSGSLSLWNDIYNNNTPLSSNNATCLKYAGGINMNVGTSNTLKEILSKDWDVIVFQQVSGSSNNYSSYEPYLTKLIADARENCTNQQVAIAWHMTWSYKDTHPVSGPHGEDGWEGICNTVKQMMSNNGIDIIIPTGTAIQNARNSSVNTDGDMTRDGAHLAYGVGRYVATSTWWQTLVAPIFEASVLGNPAIHNIAQDETGGDYQAVAVTSSNKSLCQLCAFQAVMDMFNVTLIADRIINDKVLTPTPSIYDRVDTLETEVAEKADNIPVTSIIPQNLAPNTMYNFGTVSTATFTVPALSSTGVISGALNFYALYFVAGTGVTSIAITLPTGVDGDDTPEIAEGDYVEILIINNKASIKVWQAQ